MPPNAVNWLNSDNHTNFLNRETLMTINSTMSIPVYQKEDEEIYLNQMRTIEFPNNPNGDKPRYLISIKQPIIFTSSANSKLAKECLSYLIQTDNLGLYIKGSKGRYFPLKKETGDRRQPTPNPSQEGKTGGKLHGDSQRPAAPRLRSPK
ncbi:MAG: extracellular solute-binding protein [Okeania sp. SIO2C2]|uniref:extracellular solute-binding protein n=1 Tax=Okeania sp. SIO2C2 TaxID=2607787 RepID=UPI0013B8E6A2|nr:extracellular solute-binding protein [Okeania sp. SIO2C2]NEP89466.1 extracellular solute-binding protein [Okeania sp. SIO2C2]